MSQNADTAARQRWHGDTTSSAHPTGNEEDCQYPHKLTSVNFLWFHFNTAVTPLPVHRQPTTASFRCHHCLSIAPSHPRHTATTPISACQQALFTPSLRPFDLATTALLPRHYGPLTSTLRPFDIFTTLSSRRQNAPFFASTSQPTDS